MGARTSAGADTFNIWSAGGIYLNGSVHAASDRDLKEGFSFVSGREVLDKVVEMPITKWRFKTEGDDIKHIGPVAQDFMATFGYGASDKHITSTDADGVALAAIQGLNEKLEETQSELAEKQAEIDRLEAWQIAQALELKGHTHVEVWRIFDTAQPAYDGANEVQVWDLATTLLSEGYDPDQGPSQRTRQRRAMPANF